ncbi:hypothetical protein ACQPZ2_34555 [Nocardia pseudovaccinii]|uniref:hypothetical protein n=1 Tax=Nocardia pseudovaccinii TaxID=189540 RepID=UPI003D8C08A8
MSIRRIVLALLFVAFGIASISGCGSTVRGLALPAPLGAADTADPNIVLRNGFSTMFGWRPQSDNSPDDAYARARPYLTDQLGARARETTSGGSKTQWKAWADAKAKVEVTVQVTTDEHPADQSARIDRVVLIGQTITDAAAKPIENIEITVWATVVQTEQGWRIHAMHF